MSRAKLFFSSIRPTAQLLKTYYQSLFLLHVIPAALVLVVEEVTPLNISGYSSFFLAAIAVLLSSLITLLSTSATLVFLIESVSSRNFSVSHSYKAVFNKLPELLPALFTLSILWMVGILAMILPGIHLMVRYHFVPAFILIDQGPKQPLFSYFYRAKQLSRKFYFTILLLVLTDFGCGLLATIAQTMLHNNALYFPLILVEATVLNTFTSVIFMRLNSEGGGHESPIRAS